MCTSSCKHFSSEQRPEDMPLTLSKMLLSARQGWSHCPIHSSAGDVTKEAPRAATDVCRWPHCSPDPAAGQTWERSLPGMAQASCPALVMGRAMWRLLSKAQRMSKPRCQGLLFICTLAINQAVKVKEKKKLKKYSLLTLTHHPLPTGLEPSPGNVRNGAP